MTPLFRARRRAERFDSWVEGGRRDDVDPSTADLLELVGALRSVSEPPARPEFVADLRERLMLAAESELAPATPDRQRDAVERLTIKPSRTRRERRLTIALGAAAIIGATTSMAVASQSAIPGDALYPVKRAIENTQTGISVGDDAKGETILGNASGRLDEVDELTRSKDPDVKLVTQTLNTFTEQATQAADHLMSDYEANGDEESIQQLHDFNAQSVESLNDLQGVIPPAAHDALLDAAQQLVAIDTAAQNICPDCGDGLTELPPSLVAGASQTLDDVTGLLAGGELPGAGPTGAAQQQDGPQSPSGLNPPETPIEIPDQTGDVTTDPDDPVPTPDGTDPTTEGPETNTGDGGDGNGNGGNGNGGKGDKPPVDLGTVTGPVTDTATTVTEVVTGVVSGVNGLLNGLTGGTP